MKEEEARDAVDEDDDDDAMITRNYPDRRTRWSDFANGEQWDTPTNPKEQNQRFRPVRKEGNTNEERHRDH